MAPGDSQIRPETGPRSHFPGTSGEPVAYGMVTTTVAFQVQNRAAVHNAV